MHEENSNTHTDTDVTESQGASEMSLAVKATGHARL